ncbi:MAG: carboxypeptidase regulatory-like domain-containing protein [Acidobacteria bacterium]|nr:carboxypeptidase regulatory-like domain-containing protein [Acidobacteriota bacterium]MBS1865501.1 carboxypeptidase regulatory-like domain-containing protein [Acidobacteriota bacterium]
MLRILGALVLSAASASFGACAANAQAKPAAGKVTGVVRDAGGTPQMGASVELIPEIAGALSSQSFLTNTQGIFRSDKLLPGLYTVRVTLAGFLPTLQQHVRINANLTTMVRIEMESMFASLDQLRRRPAANSADGDDWKWVLRSASGMRPVLQWDEQGTAIAADGRTEMGKNAPHMLLEFTDGARRPGSVSNIASAPGTSFAYDQKLGGASRLLVAGQMSYEDSAAGGVATIWLPTGTLGAGPHTALVLRESKLGDTGLTFRGVRLDQGGAAALGDRVLIRYGAEYVLVGLGSSASSLRPRVSAEARINDAWKAAVIFASQPGGPNSMDASNGDLNSTLSEAMGQLDAFPALMWRGGRPVLQGGYHEEMAAERKLGEKGKLQIAAFHDDNRHMAVFGQGRELPIAEYFQDSFSNGFAYDGGSSSSWGARVALREKLSDDLELTTVYARGGVLSPGEEAGGPLRDSLRTAARNSVGTNVTWTSRRTRTKLTTGYKWVDGPALTRLDNYGEALYQMDPFLHVSIRQQLPRFGLGRWEAIADCDNLLAQGYISMNMRDGQAVLVPAFRTVRGGLSVQF